MLIINASGTGRYLLILFTEICWCGAPAWCVSGISYNNNKRFNVVKLFQVLMNILTFRLQSGVHLIQKLYRVYLFDCLFNFLAVHLLFQVLFCCTSFQTTHNWNVF